MRMKSIIFGLGDESVQRVATEEEFQKAISDACDFIVRLNKCGLNIILPEDEGDCQWRFELLVNLLVTEKGYMDDQPEWLTREMEQRAARTIGARIYNMQQHLAERPVVKAAQALLHELNMPETETKAIKRGFLSRLLSRS